MPRHKVAEPELERGPGVPKQDAVSDTYGTA